MCAWKVPGDCEKLDSLMVPPRISSVQGGGRPIIVKERENLKLTCATYGDPQPVVSWSRKDGHTIIDGQTLRREYIIPRGGFSKIIHRQTWATSVDARLGAEVGF